MKISKTAAATIIGVIILAAIIWFYFKNSNGSNAASRSFKCTNPVTGQPGVIINGICQSTEKVIVAQPIIINPKPHENCKPKEKNINCTPSYSTPDGMTWVLDSTKSNDDRCCYLPTSPAPTPAI